MFEVIKVNKIAYAWDYSDMKGIDPRIYQNHIYIDESRHVQQHPRIINLTLIDIIKYEIKKLLKVNFIFPISGSKWISPLVIVPNKDKMLRVCMDYIELNKAIHKDQFPLPFIDWLLDILASKKYLFLDGFSGYNQIEIAKEDQEKTTFTCAWGTYAYKVLPFGICNAPVTFQKEILAFFCWFDTWICWVVYGWLHSLWRYVWARIK